MPIKIFILIQRKSELLFWLIWWMWWSWRSWNVKVTRNIRIDRRRWWLYCCSGYGRFLVFVCLLLLLAHCQRLHKGFQTAFLMGSGILLLNHSKWDVRICLKRKCHLSIIPCMINKTKQKLGIANTQPWNLRCSSFCNFSMLTYCTHGKFHT